MPEMVEMIIDSVRVSLTNQQRIVLLRELNREYYLPIWIGPYEAEAITIALQEIEVARPQTHDLLMSVLNHLQGRLIRVEVVALKGDVFYGNLVIDHNGTQINVDARPSDSIALAVRAHVPILVSKEILDEAGITPDREIKAEAAKEEGTPAAQPEKPAEESTSSERLSVFEDFLNNIDLDDLSGKKGSDKPDSDSGQEPGDEPDQKNKPRPTK